MKKIILIVGLTVIVAIGGRAFWAYQQVKSEEQRATILAALGNVPTNLVAVVPSEQPLIAINKITTETTATSTSKPNKVVTTQTAAVPAARVSTPTKSRGFSASSLAINSGEEILFSWTTGLPNVELGFSPCAFGVTIVNVSTGSLIECASIHTYPGTGSAKFKFVNSSEWPVTLTARWEVGVKGEEIKFNVRNKIVATVATTNSTAKKVICDTPTVVDIDGNIYNTVQIGTQCWMKQNMRVGTMLPAGTLPSNNNLIEKWCYDDNLTICNSDGGLYYWAEAMQIDPSCNSNSCTVSVNQQGICPAGFHIPADSEYKILEMFLGMNQAQADGGGSERGWDEGTKLKMSGTSGFNATLSGDRFHWGVYENRGTISALWTSSQNLGESTVGYSGPDTVWARQLYSYAATVGRASSNKASGYSVRCLKN